MKKLMMHRIASMIPPKWLQFDALFICNNVYGYRWMDFSCFYGSSLWRDESDEEDFLMVNGREYPRKVVIEGGSSAEIEKTLASCISRALPGVIESLRLQTPFSALEQVMGRLLNTISFIDAMPSFQMKQWHVIVTLFLDALSVHRIPSLGPQIMNKRLLIHKVLDAAGITFEEYETMKELMIPLGRLPKFSA